MTFNQSRLCLMLLIYGMSACMSHVAADVYITLSHPEQQHTITLIADLGFGDPDLYPLSEPLAQQIQSSQLMVETEQGTNKPSQAFQHAILTSQKNQLKNSLKPATWNQLLNWLKPHEQQQGMHLVTALSPHWALAMIENMNLKERAAYGITHHLHAQNKTTTALMTAQQQQDWFLSFDDSAICAFIDQALDENDMLYDALLSAWKNNNQAFLKTTIAAITQGDAGQHIQAHYDQLNTTLSQQLQNLTLDDDVVVAINIVSYLGNNNVISRLQAAGYQLKGV